MTGQEIRNLNDRVVYGADSSRVGGLSLRPDPNVQDVKYCLITTENRVT